MSNACKYQREQGNREGVRDCRLEQKWGAEDGEELNCKNCK